MTVPLQHIILFLSSRPTTTRIRMSKDKRTMPSRKRSFDEFAEGLPRFKWGIPYLHNNKADGTYRLISEPIKPNLIPNYIHALGRTYDQSETVKKFRNHAWTLRNSSVGSRTRYTRSSARFTTASLQWNAPSAFLTCSSDLG